MSTRSRPPNTPLRKPRPAVEVYVSDHARERMRERGGIKGARVVEEVRAAMIAGRISADKPPGFHGAPRDDCLYCWNDERAYALKAADNAFVVVTVVSRV